MVNHNDEFWIKPENCPYHPTKHSIFPRTHNIKVIPAALIIPNLCPHPTPHHPTTTPNKCSSLAPCSVLSKHVVLDDAALHLIPSSLQWRHNERDGVSNHQRLHCLLKHLFGRRSKKTSQLRVAGLCAGNSPVTGQLPVQKASNAKNVSIWWRHRPVTEC